MAGHLHSAQETAILVAVILARSGQKRARLSGRTIRFLARRQNLRSAFLALLRDELVEHGWLFSEIEAGGFGAERLTLLSASKPVTSNRWLDEDIRRALRRGGEIDFAGLLNEIGPNEPDYVEED